MYYIVYGSVTYATRIKRLFDNERGFVSVLHTPSVISTGGCSYSLKLNKDKAKRAVELSKRYGVKVIGVYREEGKEFVKVDLF